jgi:hypothetical protein
MSWMVIVILLVIIILAALAGMTSKAKDKSGDFTYQKVKALFTPAERSFLGVLKLAVTDEVEIYGKVRIADVITPAKGQERGDWQKAFNKISAKHFDFLLCHKSDQTPICAIELNDSSHNSAKVKARDAFVISACDSANFPLVQFTAKATYKVTDIQQALADHLPNTVELADALSSSSQEMEIPESDQKICPKCASEMTIKVAKKGKNIGNQFWACSAFPNCRHIESIPNK